MIGEMVCPDCGGVVGATEPTEAGPPCRCYADVSSGNHLSGTGALSDGSNGGGNASASDVAPAPVEKLCRLCGTNVAGHTRFKDSLGYLCRDCKRAETDRENQGRKPCRVCGKLVKPENLTEYEGTRMCPDCHGQRVNMRKQEIKRMGFQGARNRDEMAKLGRILLVGGVLLAIILIGIVINHFRH